VWGGEGDILSHHTFGDTQELGLAALVAARQVAVAKQAGAVVAKQQVLLQACGCRGAGRCNKQGARWISAMHGWRLTWVGVGAVDVELLRAGAGEAPTQRGWEATICAGGDGLEAFLIIAPPPRLKTCTT
jgi:hypothetical protein